jgi:hypothetical protein
MTARPEPTACGAQCVDLQLDFDHCGECGRTCDTDFPPFYSACFEGECVE